MAVRNGLLRTPSYSHAAFSFASARAGAAAEALTTLVQGCYPTASVVFTHSCGQGVSGNFDALPSRLQSALAARSGLQTAAVDAGYLLARRSWDCCTATSTPTSLRWWDVVSALSPPQNAYASLLSSGAHGHATSGFFFCPDAIVYIEGVETADVANVIAPRLMQSIPGVDASDSVGCSSATHAGERQEPIYCRRKVDWGRYWREKRCAMRGMDVMELSVPITAHATTALTEGAPARQSMLVSVANPSVTLASLHRQRNSLRRGALRTTFGYSLPCLQNALPAAVVQSVRLLRCWQERVNGSCAPCTSAFWVSAVGHLLDAPVEVAKAAPHAINAVTEAWLRVRPDGMPLSTMEVELLRVLSKPPLSAKEVSTVKGLEVAKDFLPFLLFSAVIRDVQAGFLASWNAHNAFLPAERFEGTSDVASATALSQCSGVHAPLLRAEFKDFLCSTQHGCS